MQDVAPAPSTPVVQSTDLIPVQNLQAGETVFKDEFSGVVIRWMGVNDPQGDGIQWVDPETFGRPSFQAMIRKGIFRPVDPNEAQAIQSQAYSAQTQVIDPLAQQAQDAFYRPQVNDLVSTACVGPGTRPGASCPTSVPVRQSEKGTRPPLCDLHKHLASEYVPSESPDPTTGASTTVWSRMSMAPRQTQQ